MYFTGYSLLRRRESLNGFLGSWLKAMGQVSGIYIAQSAGCLISDFNGVPDTYDSDHMIIAAPKCTKNCQSV